jgi:hypothetical protein
VNLVNEKHVAFLQVCQQGGDVARFLDGGTGSRFQLGAHFVCDDVCERRLAQSRGTGEQHVVQRFATSARSFHVHAQVLFNLALPDVLVDAIRAQR